MKKPKFLTSDEEKEIILLYQQGETLVKLGKRFNVNFGTVQHVLKRKNIDRRPPTVTSRKYYWNHKFFADITTEHQAYWLGFLLADGNVFKQFDRSYLQVSLSLKDIEHLQKLAQDLGESPRTVHTYHYPNLDIARLVVYSTRIASDLERYGINIKPRIFPDIPCNLCPHIIRGYFDGDGSIGIGILASGKEYQHLTFQTNDVDVLRKINKFISENCNLNLKRLRFYKRNPNAPILTWTGKNEIKKVYRYLYANSTIYLNRKANLLAGLYPKEVNK